MKTKKHDAVRAIEMLLIAGVVLGIVVVPLTAQEHQPSVAEELAYDSVQRVAEWLRGLGPEELARHSAAVAERRNVANLRRKQGVSYVCLPSCAVDDAKFLAVAGDDLVSLSDLVLDLSVTVPENTPSFLVGVFDGDGGVPDPTTLDGLSRWDIGDSVPFLYSLIAAPPGAPETQIDLSTGIAGLCEPTVDEDGRITLPDAECSVAGSTLANGAWQDFPTIYTGPEALAPSGVYRYRLEVRQATPSTLTINAFKVRTSAVVTIRVDEQPFSYIASVNSADDFLTIYPGGVVTDEIYDGEFRYFFDVESNRPELVLWDGDFDRGDHDGVVNQDLDDPDTPNTPFLPLFDITPDVVFEDVSTGTVGSSGDPPDNVEPQGEFSFFVRAPSVRADVIFADGRVFPNENPSGNQEWEQFLVSTRAGCNPTVTCVANGMHLAETDSDPTGFPCADACMPPVQDQIPAGIYELRVQGVDLINLNALRIPDLLCVDENGVPCDPLRLFVIGDTVFLDKDKDGVQGCCDPGIPGVIVYLLDEDGNVVDVTVTDADGHYSFEVDEGTYTVRVAPENFTAPAAGVAIGDRVWLDDNDGLDCELGLLGMCLVGTAEPGIANVRLNAFGVGMDQVAGTADDVFYGTALTNRDGAYLFNDLVPGEHYVDVVDATVPAGLALSTAAGALDPSVIAPTLAARRALDFPYGDADGQAVIGGVVYSDADADGELAPHEAGIGGVTVDLVDSATLAVVATAITAPDGSYLFTGVSPGMYVVDVTDTDGVLAGYTYSLGLLNNLEPSAVVMLGAADAILDRHFGFNQTALFDVTDRVWRDLDSNGLFDNDDVAIAGVTIDLIRSPGPFASIVATATAGADGRFVFPDLPDGAYALSVSDLSSQLSALLPTTPGAARGVQRVELAFADLVGDSFGYNDVPVLDGLEGTTVKAPEDDFDAQTDTVVDQNVLDYDFGYYICEDP